MKVCVPHTSRTDLLWLLLFFMCLANRWEDTLKVLLAPQDTAAAAAGGCSRLYEVGPGHQIKAMVRRINTTAWKDFTNVAAA
jgi:hypothetical protein